MGQNFDRCIIVKKRTMRVPKARSCGINPQGRAPKARSYGTHPSLHDRAGIPLLVRYKCKVLMFYHLKTRPCVKHCTHVRNTKYKLNTADT